MARPLPLASTPPTPCVSRQLRRPSLPLPPPRRARHTTTITHASLGVVVTGATRGLGFELASGFLQAGDRVVVCGREASRVTAALAELKTRHPTATVYGTVCDVGAPGAADELASFAKDKIHTVDRWLNNAGASTSTLPLTDIDPHRIAGAVSANVTGTLLGCRAAISLFKPQPSDRSYHVFSYGFSSWGRSLSKTSATHKASKAAVTVAIDAIADELQASGLVNIGCWQLSPGLVITDLLLEEATSPIARRIFNVLAEEPSTVARDLVPRVRAASGSRGAIEYLTPVGALTAFAARGGQAIAGGRFFDREGARVREEGATYSVHGAKLPYRVASRDGEPPRA